MTTTGHRPIGLLLKLDRGKCPPCPPPNDATILNEVYNDGITSRNNASISNFGGGFRWKSEYPWCIIKVKKKRGFLRKTSFRPNRFFLYGCNSKTNHCKYLKFSPNVYVIINRPLKFSIFMRIFFEVSLKFSISHRYLKILPTKFFIIQILTQIRQNHIFYTDNGDFIFIIT
ncbi:Uncharacterized protein FWK35_00018795 [Aphis craccivora]|uniref:Uncharacterized protein n=1 Tax=Aphis craccivora TaxID=307492 RepID=A0A6G0YIB0_APHCR|nr:Uncharacterized protein FWK35_00018795 [Aphis craccivora]